MEFPSQRHLLILFNSKEMTTTKKCLKHAADAQKKSSLETDYQDDDEIIDIDEVRNRKGITGEKKHHFIACLRTYYEDDEFQSYVKSLTGLAKYIADWRIFYVNTHHGYRLMKFRSILSEISSLSKEIGIISKHEKEEKKRYKSKYHSKK